MKKRGFTLIELLAVIVILAIIALIATPIVMNVIENARKGAAERSAENYLRAVETAIASKRLDGPVANGEYEVMSNGNLCNGTVSGTTCTATELTVEVNGDKPEAGGKILIENGQVVTTESSMTIGDYTVSYNEEGKIEATKGNAGSATVTVYRWSEDTINIGQEIDPSDIQFKTDPTTLGNYFYLKHTVENNVVTESYACAKFNIEGKNEEVCVQGGDPNYYGYAENEANYAGNALILKGLQDKGFECDFFSSFSNCYDDVVNLSAVSNGNIDAGDGTGSCNVYGDGSSNCDSWF